MPLTLSTRSMQCAVVSLGILALVGCAKKKVPPDTTHYADLEILEDTLVVKTGPIGHSQWKSERSYVLADVRNSGDKDLRVTMGGMLLDQAGKDVSPLGFETIEIPAGARRTFALVDSDSAFHPAASAKLEVRGAVPITYEKRVFINEGYVHKNLDGVVAAGVVVNKGEPQAKVVVIAGFYDDKGKPMKRPFTVITVDGGATRPVTLNGPQGSRSGYLFLGEVMH